MKAVLMILIYVGVILSPLILSWVVGGEPRPFRHEIGSGLGILAFSMILAEFVLSGRFKSISNGIGMDVTMRFHQIMARTALAFALLHPFLYRGSPSGGPRPWDPSRQLTLTTELWYLASGIAAFLLLPALVSLAIGRTQLDYKYETWRLMHGIGALIIALLLWHHAIYAGRYGGEPALVWLWTTLTAVAAGSLLYVYIVKPLSQFRRPWVVNSIERLTPRQWCVRLSPLGKRLDFKAGQFAWLNIGHSPFSLFENPFSISSAPSQGPDVEFVIKELGDFTGNLDKIKPGTRAYLDAPFGSLCIDGVDVPGVVLIAGGIGVAPMLSILREMHLTHDPRASFLIYGNRTEQQIVFGVELRRLSKTSQTDVIQVVSEPGPDWSGEVGLVGAALLNRVLSPDQIAKWLFVMCGPPQMMDGIEEHLLGQGVPSDRILLERFTYD